MKFQLKFEYSFNCIDKLIYTYKLSQEKHLVSYTRSFIDIREEAKKIIHKIFDWSISNKVEILIHKDEKYTSLNYYIYIYLILNKNHHQSLKENILIKHKQLINISNEDLILNIDYLKNNFKKILMCYIENIFYKHNYENIGNYFIKDSLNNCNYFNNYKKDDSKFTKNKLFKDLNTTTHIYLAYEFPLNTKDDTDDIKLEKIENKLNYFFIICNINFTCGILYFTEIDCNKKTIKKLRDHNRYEIYNKKYLSKLNLFATKDSVKIIDTGINVTYNSINFNNKILMRYPYFIYTKSFYVFPFLTKEIIIIFSNYNDYFIKYIGNQINNYLIFTLNKVCLLTNEEIRLNNLLNSLEDEEKDLVADNIYNIITSIEESNCFLTNFNYQIKLNILFKMNNNININIYDIKSIEKFFNILHINNKENETEKHNFIIQLIEFYLFIKTLNNHEKEIKTIETDSSSKIEEDKISESEIEESLTDKFLIKLEDKIEKDKNNNIIIEDFWKNTGSPIINLCNIDNNNKKEDKKNCVEQGKKDIKEKQMEKMRRQRELNVMKHANIIETNNYDKNVIKTNFYSNKSVIIMENSKEGYMKDIVKNTFIGKK